MSTANFTFTEEGSPPCKNKIIDQSTGKKKQIMQKFSQMRPTIISKTATEITQPSVCDQKSQADEKLINESQNCDIERRESNITFRKDIKNSRLQQSAQLLRMSDMSNLNAENAPNEILLIDPQTGEKFTLN